MYTTCHPQVDVDWLYVKRKEEWRGLLQIEEIYKAEIINIVKYLDTKYKEDQIVNTVKSHTSNQPNMKSISATAAKFTEELRQSNENRGTQKEGI